MINKEWTYRANWVKHPKDQYTAFQVGVKDKRSGKWKNYDIFVLEKVPLQDGDEIQITDIISVDQNMYTDRSGQDRVNYQVTASIQVVGQEPSPNAFGFQDEPVDTVFSEGSPIMREETVQEEVKEEPILDITSDDLPF